jgi:hypothetical protein
MKSSSQKSATDNCQTNPTHSLIFKLSALLIVVVGCLVAIYIIPAALGRVGSAGVDTLDKTAAVLNKYLSSKEKFDATFGAIISEQQLNRLQFYQRNQVALFRIVRYKGPDSKNYDYTEFYKRESDKRRLATIPIFLDQYCEWLAKGSYEFNFYIDMSDLTKWGYKWEPKQNILTLFPPDIEANTPAELEPLVYTCISDSVSIDETYTKNQLEKAIPELKQSLADDQKQFMYDEASVAIKKMYRQFLLNLIPASAHDNELPKIIVSFPDKKRLHRKKLLEAI